MKKIFSEQFSCFNGHYRFYSLEYFLKNVSSIGFKNIELWTGPMHFFVDYNYNDNIEKVKKLLKKYNLNIVALCPEQTNPKPNNIAIKDKNGQCRVLSYYKKIIDIAKEFGCKKVVVTAGYGYFDEEKNEAYNRSVLMMKKISSYAKKKDVFLAMEALQEKESNLVNNSSELKKYLEDVSNDNLKVCLDIGALEASKQTIEDYFKLFKKDVIHIHYVDGVGHLGLGDGKRDIKKDINIIQKYNYDNYLTLETVNDRYFSDPKICDQKNMKILKEIL